jgi:hypothetical protein
MSKKKIETFALAFGNVQGNMQQIVKQEIMEACDWNSSQLFSMKKNGTRRLTDKEEALVNYVFDKHGIDAATGEVKLNA